MNYPPYKLGDWIQDGSLYDNMMHHFHWAYPHPRPDADPEAIITLFNGQANLTFNDTGKNLALALPIITQLLAKRQNIVAIECMYPLSG